MTVQEFMLVSGTPINFKGFRYLEMAIEKTMEKPNASMTDIIQEVADELGLCWGTTYFQIRNSINSGFPHMDEDVKKRLFKRWMNDNYAPPLKEYVSTVAYGLRTKII